MFVPNLVESSEENALALRRSDVVAKVSLVPTYINPAKGFLQPVNLFNGKRKGVCFDQRWCSCRLYFTQFKGETEDNLGQRGVKTYESILGVRTQTVKKFRMSLSGMGASDPDGRTIYHQRLLVKLKILRQCDFLKNTGAR